MKLEKSWQLGRFKLSFRLPEKRKVFGYFGGGWTSKINLAWAPGTILLEFLRPSIRIDWKEKA